MSGPLVEMVGVSKTLGDRTVLQQVNFVVHPGEVVGIIGANGSGKTTLLRLLAGLLYADAGEVRVGGVRVAPGMWGRMPTQIGVLIESPGFLPQFSGLQNLLFLAGIRRMIGRSAVAEHMAHWGLDPANRQAVRKYSLGMRQRLGLTQAVMESPRVLLLDEPTNSLDHAGVRVLGEMLPAAAAHGVSTVLVSHVMEDINAWCDRVFRLDGGTLTVVRAARDRAWRVVLRRWADMERLSDVFQALRVVDAAADGPAVVGTGPWTDEADLVAVLTQRGVDVVAVEVARS